MKVSESAGSNSTSTPGTPPETNVPVSSGSGKTVPPRVSVVAWVWPPKPKSNPRSATTELKLTTALAWLKVASESTASFVP